MHLGDRSNFLLRHLLRGDRYTKSYISNVEKKHYYSTRKVLRGCKMQVLYHIIAVSHPFLDFNGDT